MEPISCVQHATTLVKLVRAFHNVKPVLPIDKNLQGTITVLVKQNSSKIQHL